MIRLLLLRLLPGRLLPLLVAWEIYRLLRGLSEERRVARARPVAGPAGQPSPAPIITTPGRLVGEPERQPRLAARWPRVVSRS
jgi:hypothetical protein